MENLDLEEIRQAIDRVDSQLAKLFEERMNIVLQVAAYKKAHELPVKDTERENLVLAKCKDRVNNPAYVKGLQKIMQQIMDTSCDLEEVILGNAEIIPVGYQGVPGAYSHLAMQEFFAGQVIEEINYTLFEDVVQAVREGKIKYGVLPIENSSTGGITEVYDLVRRYDCFIVGEKCLKIEHHLLAYPGTKLEDITEVYSHPQGFAQCRQFFKNYPAMKQVAYFNTAKGAELVSQKQTNYMAAVAGKQAAERYGLSIVAPSINANKNNYTRFFVIAKTQKVDVSADKITLVVALKHEAGSLYKLLGHFNECGLNLLNIESRPIEGKSWEYFFHIDVSGNLQEDKVKEAMRRISAEATECKILGNYVADRVAK